MAFPGVDELTALIAPVTSSHRLDVEGVTITRAGRKSVVAIKLDGDSRPDLDLLELVSQDISALLDAVEERGEVSFGAGYTLEVSTPGVDLPLTAPRHWRRNRHRLVQLTEDGQNTQWRIGALNDAETAVILVTTRKNDLVVRELEFTDSVRAVVEVEFAKPPAAEIELTGQQYDTAIQWREDNK